MDNDNSINNITVPIPVLRDVTNPGIQESTLLNKMRIFHVTNVTETDDRRSLRTSHLEDNSRAQPGCVNVFNYTMSDYEYKYDSSDNNFEDYESKGYENSDNEELDYCVDSEDESI